MEHLREGRSVGDWGFNRTENASVDRRIEAAILASEVSNLENLEGFFLTPGYTLKLTFPYVSPEPHSQAFIASERSDPAYVKAQEDESPDTEETFQVQKPKFPMRAAKPQSNHSDSGDTFQFEQE